MHSTQPRSPTNLSSYLSFAAAGPNGLKINRFTDGQDAQAQPPGAAASDCLDSGLFCQPFHGQELLWLKIIRRDGSGAKPETN